jgi:hypothetical protein
MHTSLVDWLGLLLSAITVILVGLYLRETNRIRIEWILTGATITC